MYQRQLSEKVNTQESALKEMQQKQQQELEALKNQEVQMKSYENKQEEMDNVISFFLRKHATQN